MCGRFVRTSPGDVVRRAFGVTSMADVDLRPRYNVCPGEPVATIVQHGADRRLGALRWGLGPRAQINVRSETAARRAPSGEALRRRRCAVVADGFYEWKKEDGTRRPHFFRLASGQPFAFAALWSREGGPSSAPGTAILTRDADDVVRPVHSRMPVILVPDALDRWLDGSLHDPAAIESLLRLPHEPLVGHPVSTLVNSGRNDSPECIRPDGASDRTLRLVPRLN
jgi:putative SOS response-associated peptidase YedK